MYLKLVNILVSDLDDFCTIRILSQFPANLDELVRPNGQTDRRADEISHKILRNKSCETAEFSFFLPQPVPRFYVVALWPRWNGRAL